MAASRHKFNQMPSPFCPNDSQNNEYCELLYKTETGITLIYKSIKEAQVYITGDSIL